MRTNPWHLRRRAVSLVELEVAFVVFGIALSGIAPLTVMYSRQLQMLESRLSNGTTYYLSPAEDAWAQKLGAAATISSTAPSSSGTGAPTQPANLLQILTLDKPFADDTVTATVLVNPSS